MESWQSTPTQYENDLARLGINTDTHEWDGSPVDPTSRDPTQPPGGPGDLSPLPIMGALAPTSAPLPNVELVVTGPVFGTGTVIVFNHAALKTTRVTPTELRASVARFSGPPGEYDVLVRNAVGDSEAVKFTFTAPV